MTGLIPENTSKVGSYVDYGWPKSEVATLPEVTELTTITAGALSPYGDIDFPLDYRELDYIHPITKIATSS